MWGPVRSEGINQSSLIPSQSSLTSLLEGLSVLSKSKYPPILFNPLMEGINQTRFEGEKNESTEHIWGSST